MPATPASSRIFEQLHQKPYCTNNFALGLKIRTKKHAIKHTYLQINKPELVTFLVFDVDREGAAFSWESVGLPEPTYTVVNPLNAHAHLIYELETPVYTGKNSSDKPKRWLADIRNAFTLRLDADVDYTGLIAKNPTSPAWRTIETNYRYSLADLSEYVADVRPARARLEIQNLKRRAELQAIQIAKGRNCKLFDVVRRHAYNSVNSFDSLEEFHDYIWAFTDDRNTQGLPIHEVSSVAKSVARWTWDRKERFLDRRVREHVLDSEDLKRRQRNAAAATNHKRSQATRARVMGAIAEIAYSSPTVTQRALAEKAGVSLRHIQGSWGSYADALRCTYQDLSRGGDFQAPVILRPQPVPVATPPSIRLVYSKTRDVQAQVPSHFETEQLVLTLPDSS